MQLKRWQHGWASKRGRRAVWWAVGGSLPMLAKAEKSHSKWWRLKHVSCTHTHTHKADYTCATHYAHVHTPAECHLYTPQSLFLLVSHFSLAVDSGFGTLLPFLCMCSPHMVGPVLSDSAYCFVAGIGMSGIIMLSWAYRLTHACSLPLLKREGVCVSIEAKINPEGAKHPIKRALTMSASCSSTDKCTIAEEFNLTQEGFILSSVLSCLQIPEIKFLPFFSLSILRVL